MRVLTEKEAIWARALLKVLEDHGIAAVTEPVYGVGIAVRAGVPERLYIYVPRDKLTEAKALQEELFSEEM